jgi:hypothetical protein
LACWWGAASSQCRCADIPGTDAILRIETLACGDVRLQNMIQQAEESVSCSQYVLTATGARIAIDYGPARYDIVSQPVRRAEDCAAAEINARFAHGRGFCSVRRGWRLPRLFGLPFRVARRIFPAIVSGVPGYIHVASHGWHVMAGGRRTYEHGNAILQVTLLKCYRFFSDRINCRFGVVDVFGS